jgi:hypothetical protein
MSEFDWSLIVAGLIAVFAIVGSEVYMRWCRLARDLADRDRRVGELLDVEAERNEKIRNLKETIKILKDGEQSQLKLIGIWRRRCEGMAALGRRIEEMETE